VLPVVLSIIVQPRDAAAASAVTSVPVAGGCASSRISNFARPVEPTTRSGGMP
jgi:hypothetical protein